MKVIIAGSRGIEKETTFKAIERARLEYPEWTITEVVCGCCAGPDRHGKEWAEQNKIPVKFFPADWSQWGKIAGRVRNREMAAYADALIAAWDGRSNGTRSMFHEMMKLQKPFYIFRADYQK